ncbi:MAG TPA: hypothetical protein VJ124_26050 [Pyrinomonadaceae bacterium]|nr:hypothetical protein [Pyrinomonadaceae bacterium]
MSVLELYFCGGGGSSTEAIFGRSLSVDWGQKLLGGVLAGVSQEKAFGGFWRSIVELTGLDATEVAGVTDAVADVYGGRLQDDEAAVSDRLPPVRTIKLHLPTLTLKSGTPASG